MKKVLAVLSIFLLVSCAAVSSSQEFTPNSEKIYTSKPADTEIEVFRSSLPEKKYKEIGFISVRPGGSTGIFSGTPDTFTRGIEIAKQIAREKGGDAIIDLRQVGSGIRLVLTATLIKWKESE